jgi:hypothetical protein
LKIKLSIPNPATSAHLMHLSAQLHTGEAFGFEAAFLIGCRLRSKVSRKVRAKIENAEYFFFAKVRMKLGASFCFQFDPQSN